MREPHLLNKKTGEDVPYSRAPRFVLARIANGERLMPAPGVEVDHAFRREYAARILKERLN